MSGFWIILYGDYLTVANWLAANTIGPALCWQQVCWAGNIIHFDTVSDCTTVFLSVINASGDSKKEFYNLHCPAGIGTAIHHHWSANESKRVSFCRLGCWEPWLVIYWNLFWSGVFAQNFAFRNVPVVKKLNTGFIEIIRSMRLMFISGIIMSCCLLVDQFKKNCGRRRRCYY